MTDIFLKLLNMSIAASWLVLAVMLLRLFLKNTPKWINCLLWSIVAVRLVVPVFWESSFSLIPSPEVIPQDVAVSQTPAIYSAIPAVNSAVNPLFTRYFSSGGNALQTILFGAATFWLTGVLAMLLYSGITYLKLRRRVGVSLLYRDNVYLCDHVDSPFLLGIFRPRIYIPSDMEEETLVYVLAHENAHIKRRDHWWKPLGFLLLSVYWFNPLLWLAYVLLCRDIEGACDEKVITGMDPGQKMGYSAALASCSVHRRMVMACPVAFGEVGVKERIKGVLNYKKPALWLVCASVLACAVMAACFLTNPHPCEHVYSQQITTEPTCTETGVQTRVCAHCQHSYTVSVNMAEHIYDAGVVTREATCTHQGSRQLHCIACGKEKTEAIGMTEHIAGEPMYYQAPDCAHTGERAATCASCHAVYVIQILPTNDDHELKETVVKEATCAHPGEGVISCTRCDYSQSCSYAQLEHQYTKSTARAATCLKTGVERYVCHGCGTSYQQETPLAEHTYTKSVKREATCQHSGVEVYTCTVCRSFYEVEVPPKDHDWQATGRGYRVCTHCGTRGAENYTFRSRETEAVIPDKKNWP